MNAGGILELCAAVTIKAVGLTVVGQLASRLCKDAGEGALSYGVELASRIAVLGAAMPLISRILELLGEIMSI